MVKTVFITGASSGIGRSTALQFQQKGWNVIATVRAPEKAADFAKFENVHCLSLDVNDENSIQRAVGEALQKIPAIDVLINNAGYALLGPFEACTPEQIQRQFQTNVFGLMAMTRAFLPHFRERRAGIIINVASMGGRLAFPLYSSYHATKWAVEGFSESLQYELEPFNIRVKIIEPGVIKTDFYGRSPDVAQKPGLTAYDSFVAKVLPNQNRAAERGSSPDKVAEIIYKAATDGSQTLRYPAAGNSEILLFLRRFLPDGAFSKIVRSSVIRE